MMSYYCNNKYKCTDNTEYTVDNHYEENMSNASIGVITMQKYELYFVLSSDKTKKKKLLIQLT